MSLSTLDRLPDLDKPPVFIINFFDPWLVPTLMARSSFGAARLAAARPIGISAVPGGTVQTKIISTNSDISSIDHLIMRQFVSGPPRYHLAIKGVREQFVVVEQNSGP